MSTSSPAYCPPAFLYTVFSKHEVNLATFGNLRVNLGVCSQDNKFKERLQVTWITIHFYSHAYDL